MHRPTLALVSCVLALAVTVSTGARAQEPDWSKVEIKTEPLRGGVYVLFGSGGNIGVLVAGDGVLLVDDQFAPLTPKIVAAVKALTDLPIKGVFNTHWHGDHVGGNENLEKAGAVIVAHQNVRKRMMEGQVSKFFDRTTPPAPGAALPLITFAHEQMLHFGDETVRALHIEHAHTDGDAIVHFEKANVIHMGDTFFSSFYPIIDLESGGSINGLITAADTALTWANVDTKIVPGHGPVSDRSGLLAYRTMLVGVRDAVRKQVKQGKSLEQAQAAKPTAAWDAKWGQGYMKPDRFVELVYKDLSLEHPRGRR